MPKNNLPDLVIPVEKPTQLPESDLAARLVETSSFIRVTEARMRYRVSGKDFTVAVLDTGLRTTHIDFQNRVPAQVNFSTDNKSDPANASDGNGHGTNVGGIIVANGVNKGIAPGADIVPIKVLTNAGGGSFKNVNNAFQWVLDNHAKHKISVVNLSLGDGNNYQEDDFAEDDQLWEKIRVLRQLHIPVVVAAGNDFYKYKSKQGMSYPAIISDCVSVGAVYDGDEGSFRYANGAMAYTSGPGRITPFSQRLHWKLGKSCRTDIFAPGAPITSSGIKSDKSVSAQQGTSQAAPVISGVILLMQELYHEIYKEIPNPPKSLSPKPSVQQLVTWMRNGGVVINDGIDEDDNVINTGLDFVRVDAYGALHQVRKHFVRQFSFLE